MRALGAVAAALLLGSACAVPPTSVGVSTAGFASVHALRFRPGADVALSLWEYVNSTGLQAAAVLSAVGSLTQLSVRLANASDATVFTQAGDGSATTWEIVSLTGTLEVGGGHLHISAADHTGRTLGGHLMPGSLIYTTLEVMLGDAAGLAFSRQLDPVAQGGSGYDELVISQVPLPDAPVRWARADALGTAGVVLSSLALVGLTALLLRERARLRALPVARKGLLREGAAGDAA